MEKQQSTGRFAAAGGVITAILASSCCVGPLVLVALGASGAWIGNLSVLEPYKLYFAGIALLFLGLGFRQVYRKPETCAEGTYCANPISQRLTKMALWFATGLVLVALTIEWWAPLFY